MTIVVYEWRKYFVTANLAYLLILQYFEYSTISTSLTRVTPERSQKVDSVVYDAKTYASTTFSYIQRTNVHKQCYQVPSLNIFAFSRMYFPSLYFWLSSNACSYFQPRTC